MSGILCRDQKGISNLVATLILIAVAVVGGAFAYTAFKGQAKSATTSADLQVQDLTAQKVSDNLYVSVTAKNVGTQALSNISVEIDPAGADVTLNPPAADPGETVSASDTLGDILSGGQEYPVRVSADTPNGSITKTMTVRVKS